MKLMGTALSWTVLLNRAGKSAQLNEEKPDFARIERSQWMIAWRRVRASGLKQASPTPNPPWRKIRSWSDYGQARHEDYK